jgi:class 3 adenylate cyclase
MGAALWAVRTQFHYAGMLLRRDRHADRGRAAALAERAHASATACGMEVLATQLGRLEAEARARQMPDGMVTILFTDLQDSTGMTERLGDLPAQALLREHNAIVREQLAAHQGFEVKTTGDGFMLAFASPQRALCCAIATQRAFAARNARRADAPLRVSLGLHSGEAIWEAGDFYGKAVIVAARLAAQARGGEILLSATVKALTEDDGGLCFDAGREMALKGLAGTHRVYAAQWAAQSVADDAVSAVAAGAA